MLQANRKSKYSRSYANVDCQHIEWFSYFPTDTAMHPVLKSLGITDKAIFFILESINGSEVKKKRNKKRDNVGREINQCVLSRGLLRPNKIKKANLSS